MSQQKAAGVAVVYQAANDCAVGHTMDVGAMGMPIELIYHTVRMLLRRPSVSQLLSLQPG